MRKLTTVTAAVALAAALIALPAVSAMASGNGTDVVILKCAEGVTAADFGVLPVVSPPVVVMLQHTDGIVAPAGCSIPLLPDVQPQPCAPCLKALIALGCEAGEKLPASPAVVQPTISLVEAGQLFGFEVFSIEKYVLTCEKPGKKK